ncbi:hypothetical protein ACIBQ0_36770 [Nocardia nova]|uniref:hypothetical protein n=1 Tax=Nocardia nova TaxID=37330 RepID=UPI0037B95EF1
MRDYREQLGYRRITRSTKLIELAAELLSDLEADEAYTEGNVEDYRREIYVSTDKRANPTTIKIENCREPAGVAGHVRRTGPPPQAPGRIEQAA